MTRSFCLFLAAFLTVLGGIRAQQQESPSPAGRFAATDAYVDATPEHAERSIASLGVYLAGAGADDLTRARALYRWMTGNVEYDVDELRNNNPRGQGPSDVLQSRSAVCSGYAVLAEALGEAMGLDVEVIDGWSKGYGYTAGQQFAGPANHAWIAVKIDGEWQLMDPTWGAGYLDERLQFTPHFQEHYFLTKPEVFVFDHFPEDGRWQLLDRPITMEEYVELAYLQPMFFLAGLEIRSHERAHIETEGRISVTLGVSQPVIMAAQVIDASSDQPLDGQLTFVQVSDREAHIHATFPRPGDYMLRVFALPMEDDGSLHWVVDYRITATRGSPTAVFPRAFAEFGRSRAWLEEPLDGMLEAGQTYLFRLRVPGALQVAVVANEEWTYLTEDDNGFFAEVTAAVGTITVCALYNAGGPCKSLLHYTGR